MSKNGKTKISNEIEITNRPNYAQEKKVNIDFMDNIKKPKRKIGIFKILMIGAILYVGNTVRSEGFSGAVEEIKAEISDTVGMIFAPVKKAQEATDKFEEKNRKTVEELDSIVSEMDNY